MAETVDKIKLLKSSSDLSTATYQIHDESHTIGNALRWMLMKNPKVEFCGYSPYSVIERMPGSPTWAPEFYKPLWDTALAHLLEFFSFISHNNPYHVPFPSAIDSLLPVSLATSSVLDTNTNNRSLTPFPYKCSSSVRECNQRSHPDVRLSSLDALITALTDLDNVCESVEDEYLKSLREGDFERWEERT